MKTDIEIAQMWRLNQSLMLLRNLAFLDDLELYRRYKAKLSFDKIRAVEQSSWQIDLGNCH